MLATQGRSRSFGLKLFPKIRDIGHELGLFLTKAFSVILNPRFCGFLAKKKPFDGMRQQAHWEREGDRDAMGGATKPRARGECA